MGPGAACLGCVCSSVPAAPSCLYCQSLERCVCRGRGWGELPVAEAKRSGLALEQGSGLLFHNLISSQRCTAASQKAAINLQPVGQGMQCSRLLGGCLNPTQPLAKQERSAKNTMEQKDQTFQSSLCSLQSHTACPPQSPWLFLPVFLTASLPGFLSLLCCSRQGAAALAVELAALLSLRRMQGPLGRGKQHQVLDSSLVSRLKQHLRRRQSRAECALLMPHAVMGMLTVPILHCPAGPAGGH